MNKTTVYLSDELKAKLSRAAKTTGRSEAEIIREGIELAVSKCVAPKPTIPLFASGDPRFADRVDEYLKGFGER